MSDREDPWADWYRGYLEQRAAIRAAHRLAFDRRKTSNILAGLLISYMLVGGMTASIAVWLVMAH